MQPWLLSQLLAGFPVTIEGKYDPLISAVATLERAHAGSLSFLATAAYRHYLPTTHASAVILAPADSPACPAGTIAVITDNPLLIYARAAARLYPQAWPVGIHPTAVIADDCQIGEQVWVGAHSVIETGVHIGNGVHIGPGCIIQARSQIEAGSRLVARVTLGTDTQIGAEVLIHPGAVIGSDGFGFALETPAQRWVKIPQLGRVRIGDAVEIGANTTIDRGTIGDTLIGEGVKIDNLVQIAHNVEIGAHTAIAGCVGIAGSVKIGRYCRIAGGVGIAGHLQIADHVVITGMSLVTHSLLKPGSYSSGGPLEATPQWRKNCVRIKQLDNLARRLKQVEQQVSTPAQASIINQPAK